MNVKSKIIRVIEAITVLLLLSPPSLFAQNLVVNGDFEMITGFDYNNFSDYTRITGGAVGEGKFIHDVTSANHGMGTIGWPSNLTGYGGSGYFLMFNGYGGDTNPTKAAWRQTVAVTANTSYTFSAQVRNLSQGLFGAIPHPAIMRMQINGQQVGADLALTTIFNWVEMTVTWNSGTDTQAVLEIVDAYLGVSSGGDDFGIDHISFTANATYSATANDDTWPLACLDTVVEIPVVDNDVVFPDIQSAEVQIVTYPSHGDATVNQPDKKIHYVFTDNTFSGTDQLKYRVGFPAQNIWSEAWVYITTGRPPEIGDLTEPGPLCSGDDLGVPTPAVTPSGLAGHWELGTSPTGSFQTFDPTNVSLSLNGRWVRYSASNECGEGHSNAVQIAVYSNAPTYDTITACDTYLWNGVTCDHSDDFEAEVLSPEGCNITAYLHFVMSDAYTETQTYSSCGAFVWDKDGQTYTSSGSYDYTVVSGNPMACDSTFTLNLTVNDAPEVFGIITVPSTLCVGSSIDVAEPQYAMNHADGGDAFWEYATSAAGPFMAFDPTTTNLNLGTYYLRFAVINGCDEAYSNVVSFRVDDKPETQAELSDLQVCEGQTLNLPEVDVTWNNEDENDRLAQWQMASTEGGPYTPISPTMPMQASYNGNWLRFVAHNSCGDGIVGPVRITVIADAEEWLETITECDAYTLPTGEVITETTMVDMETYDPCYHVVHLPVVINHSDQVNELITSCQETYEWNGMTFHHSSETQYSTVTLTNASGCDSIVNLQLDFGDYAMYTYDRVACESFVWDMNPGHVYTESVRDSVFVAATGQDDCDTWYFLNLTLGHESHIDGGNMNECSGFVWHGVPYYNDAVIYDSLQTMDTHCDSIIAYQLHIAAPVTTTLDIQACDQYELDGVIYDEPGVVFIELENLETQNGCDSIVQIRLEIKDSEAVGTIIGSSSVYVASNLINGEYRYAIDTTDVVGAVVWALSNPDWEIVESANDHCVVHVTTPGFSTLTATFTVSYCGEMTRSFDINAGYFGVEEQENHEVQVYPNPTKGTLHIEAEGIESVRLINMMGLVLEMCECSRSDSVVLDLNAYAGSVYLLEIKADKWITKKRVFLCR